VQTTSGVPGPRIVSSTLSLGAFSVFSMVLGLAGTVIITRHFSADDFGAYILVNIIASFLGQISTFGFEMAVTKFIAGTDDNFIQEHFFSTAVIVRLGAILLTGLLAWYGSPVFKILFGQSLLPGFFFYVPLLFAFDSFKSILKATLQGRLLFRKIGILNAIESVTFLVLLVIVYRINGNITLLFLARITSSCVTSIIAFVFIPIKKRIFFQRSAFMELMKFGFPLQINDIMGFIYSQIDKVAVAVFLGPADIAAYEVARKIPEYLRNFYEPFRSVYYPFISKRYALDGKQQASEFVNDAVRFVAFVTLLGAVIATLFGREILQFIFTDKYSASAPVFVILMINLSIGLISNVMGTTLVAVGDTQKPALINFFNAITSWLGSVLLIPLFALVGASVANTTGTAIAMPLNRYFLQKRIELKDSTYLKPLILFGVWALVVFLIKPELILIKIVFLLAFLVACVFLSIITKKDLALLVDGLRLNSWPPFQKLTLWISKL